MRENQRGVTLIALVVTIIVLLILAGVSIAMLTGDNGILTNAKKAQLANTEAEAIERMNVAYNTAKTEVMVKSSTTSDYDPSAEVSAKALLKTLATELGITVADGATTGTKDNYTVTLDATAKTITMTYDNGSTFTGTTTTENKVYPAIVGTITLTASDITYEAPTRNVK